MYSFLANRQHCEKAQHPTENINKYVRTFGSGGGWGDFPFFPLLPN